MNHKFNCFFWFEVHESKSFSIEVKSSRVFLSRSETIEVQQCRTGKYRSESIEENVYRSEMFEDILKSKWNDRSATMSERTISKWKCRRVCQSKWNSRGYLWVEVKLLTMIFNRSECAECDLVSKGINGSQILKILSRKQNASTKNFAPKPKVGNGHGCEEQKFQ